MIAVDSNLLIDSQRRDSRVYGAARAVLQELAGGARPWAIPWPCCFEFLSVVTNRRIWQEKTTPMEVAWRQLEDWTSSPSNRLIGETEGFLSIFGDLVRRPRVRGAIVHDARIAAICLAHGVDQLLTRDRDFSLFPELRTRDPLRA